RPGTPASPVVSPSRTTPFDADTHRRASFATGKLPARPVFQVARSTASTYHLPGVTGDRGSSEAPRSLLGGSAAGASPPAWIAPGGRTLAFGVRGREHRFDPARFGAGRLSSRIT